MSIPDTASVESVLARLIGFPTVSSESNLALIDWVAEYLDAHEVPHWRVNEGGGKASLVARIGPDVAGGIVLSGHTDVVPVKDQRWTHDPFTLTLRDGLWYGRGTCDMKSFLALALAYVPLFKQKARTRPVWLAFSHDEEIGCLGAAPMARALNDMKAAPSLVVIGEPTSMELVGGHKGIESFETIVTGREAHSSMPEQGVNAVMIMGELIATLNSIAARCRANPDTVSGFPTPYSSVHVGVVEGGTARNIVPRHARIFWEIRPLPGEDVEALLAPYHARVAELQAQMQRTDPTTGITTRQLTHVAGLKPEPEAQHLAVACRLGHCNAARVVSYGTEGGIFQQHGLPVVICGPGSIDQAHQPDEYVSVEQLRLGGEFMQRLAAEL